MVRATIMDNMLKRVYESAQSLSCIKGSVHDENCANRLSGFVSLETVFWVPSTDPSGQPHLTQTDPSGVPHAPQNLATGIRTLQHRQSFFGRANICSEVCSEGSFRSVANAWCLLTKDSSRTFVNPLGRFCV